MPRLITPVALLSATIFSFACDGGGGSDALTLAEYFAEVDEIMTEARGASATISANTQLTPIAPNASDEQIIETYREGLGPAVDALQSLSRQLNDVEPPDEVEAAHGTLTEAFEEQADLFEAWFSSDEFDQYVVAFSRADSYEDLQAASEFAAGEGMREAEEAQDAACDSLAAVADANEITFEGC